MLNQITNKETFELLTSFFAQVSEITKKSVSEVSEAFFDALLENEKLVASNATTKLGLDGNQYIGITDHVLEWTYAALSCKKLNGTIFTTKMVTDEKLPEEIKNGLAEFVLPNQQDIILVEKPVEDNPLWVSPKQQMKEMEGATFEPFYKTRIIQEEKVYRDHELYKDLERGMICCYSTGQQNSTHDFLTNGKDGYIKLGKTFKVIPLAGFTARYNQKGQKTCMSMGGLFPTSTFKYADKCSICPHVKTNCKYVCTMDVWGFDFKSIYRFYLKGKSTPIYLKEIDSKFASLAKQGKPFYSMMLEMGLEKSENMEFGNDSIAISIKKAYETPKSLYAFLERLSQIVSNYLRYQMKKQ